MRKAIGLLVLLFVVFMGWWLWSSTGEESSPVPSRATEKTTEPAKAEGGAKDGVSPDENRATEIVRDEKARARARAERDALRKRILDSMDARQRAAEQPSPSSESTGSPAASTSGAPPDAEGGDTDPEDPPATGGLTDRTGNHGYLMEVMNDELMPLADECIQMAREAQPELTGMLVVDLSIISDDALGGVIDTVGSGINNEVLDPDLLECVSESILSITLPPPPQGGRDAIALSMPVGEE